jgi:hypothetical protein
MAQNKIFSAVFVSLRLKLKALKYVCLKLKLIKNPAAMKMCGYIPMPVLYYYYPQWDHARLY